jgi:hypothetical protein
VILKLVSYVMLDNSMSAFFAKSSLLTRLEVTSFGPSGPRFAGLVSSTGDVLYLTTDMLDIGDRVEVGVLVKWDSRDPTEGGTTETLPGGQVLAFHYLKAPGFESISGLQIHLDVGELTIAAGDMPYSLFVGFGEIRFGMPEYPVGEYRRVSPT